MLDNFKVLGLNESRKQRTCHVEGQRDILEEIIATQLAPPGTIVDIGTGSGLAATKFHEAGMDVTATGFDMDDYFEPGESLPEEIRVIRDVDICSMACFQEGQFDAIWCAHVLEHVMDTGRALAELRRILKTDGMLFVAVPPHKSQVVGGHVSNGWTIGNLMYVLAVAGFDLSDGRFVKHGYNIFGIVRRGPGPLPPGTLHFSNGDLEILRDAGRFPTGFDAKQYFNGDLTEINWTWTVVPKEVPVPRARLANPPAIAPMRIGFFVPWITKGRGGTENVGQMMANAMAARGHHVHIFTFDNERAPSRWPLASEIKLIHLSEAEGDAADQQMTLEVALCNLDIIVGLHMNRTFLRYVRCAKRLGLPIVLSEHIDPRFPDWIGTFSKRERNITFSGATLIHLLVKAFCPTLDSSLLKRIRIIPNTIVEPQHQARPGEETGELRLLTVARLVPRKNLARLIDAYASLAPTFPNWRLQIVGSGAAESDLHRQAERRGIAESVEFVGHVNDPYPFYRDAHLFVLPSLFEGFPMSTLEAMAHGLPLVGYAICNGVNEQIVQGENGLLSRNANSTDSLAEDLRRLMGDASLRRSMGIASRQRFLSHYSNEIIFSAWEEMFAEAFERGAAPGPPRANEILSVKLAELVWGADA